MAKDSQDLTVEENLNRAKKKIIEMLKKKIQLAEGSSETGLREEVANTLKEEDVKEVIKLIKNLIRTTEKTNGTIGLLNTTIQQTLGYYNNTIDSLAAHYLTLVKNTTDDCEEFISRIGEVGIGLKRLSKGDFNSFDDDDLNDLVKYIDELLRKMQGMKLGLNRLYHNGSLKGVAGQRDTPLLLRTPGFNGVLNVFKDSLNNGLILFKQYLNYFSQ